MKNFLKSLKNVFWFGGSSVDVDKKRKQKNEKLRVEVFYKADDLSDYSERIRALEPFVEDHFEEPEVTFDDVDVMESYIKTSMDVKTREGSFRLVYYDNDELVLRGDEGVVEEVKDPICERLDVDLRRV